MKTVDYVFEQLYVQGQKRMLIADEVGLGKTIVAKGLIAKAFEQYMHNGGPTKENPTFNVVYICSNLTLADSNIKKLNFMGDKQYVEDTINRLTYLSYKPRRNQPFLKSTPLPPEHLSMRKAIRERLMKEQLCSACLLNIVHFILAGWVEMVTEGRN